jgi:3-oxoacyl-[acyl-carrier protein] reductase
VVDIPRISRIIYQSAGRVACVHALVTGIGRKRGIAAAIARTLADQDWDLTVTGSPEYDVESAWSEGSEADEIVASLGGAVWVPDDLADPDAPRRLFDAALEHAGPITALVNSAARSRRAGLLETTVEEFDRHVAVNARGTALMTQEFVQRFEGEWGRVINFVSGPPLVGEVAYAASKGAIEWITYSTAAELAPRNITVNAIDPGPTDTGWMGEDLKSLLDSRSPMGRVGVAADIAPLVAFLCSEGSRWITGQVLHCGGGWNNLRPH